MNGQVSGKSFITIFYFVLALAIFFTYMLTNNVLMVSVIGLWGYWIGMLCQFNGMHQMHQMFHWLRSMDMTNVDNHERSMHYIRFAMQLRNAPVGEQVWGQLVAMTSTSSPDGHLELEAVQKWKAFWDQHDGGQAPPTKLDEEPQA